MSELCDFKKISEGEYRCSACRFEAHNITVLPIYRNCPKAPGRKARAPKSRPEILAELRMHVYARHEVGAHTALDEVDRYLTICADCQDFPVGRCCKHVGCDGLDGWATRVLQGKCRHFGNGSE